MRVWIFYAWIDLNVSSGNYITVTALRPNIFMTLWLTLVVPTTFLTINRIDGKFFFHAYYRG